MKLSFFSNFFTKLSTPGIGSSFRKLPFLNKKADEGWSFIERNHPSSTGSAKVQNGENRYAYVKPLERVPTEDLRHVDHDEQMQGRIHKYIAGYEVLLEQVGAIMHPFVRMPKTEALESQYLKNSPVKGQQHVMSLSHQLDLRDLERDYQQGDEEQYWKFGAMLRFDYRVARLDPHKENFKFEGKQPVTLDYERSRLFACVKAPS